LADGFSGRVDNNVSVGAVELDGTCVLEVGCQGTRDGGGEFREGVLDVGGFAGDFGVLGWEVGGVGHFVDGG
jgi:hypothetical protein